MSLFVQKSIFYSYTYTYMNAQVRVHIHTWMATCVCTYIHAYSHKGNCTKENQVKYYAFSPCWEKFYWTVMVYIITWIRHSSQTQSLLYNNITGEEKNTPLRIFCSLLQKFLAQFPICWPFIIIIFLLYYSSQLHTSPVTQ